MTSKFLRLILTRPQPLLLSPDSVYDLRDSLCLFLRHKARIVLHHGASVILNRISSQFIRARHSKHVCRKNISNAVGRKKRSPRSLGASYKDVDAVLLNQQNQNIAKGHIQARVLVLITELVMGAHAVDEALTVDPAGTGVANLNVRFAPTAVISSNTILMCFQAHAERGVGARSDRPVIAADRGPNISSTIKAGSIYCG